MDFIQKLNNYADIAVTRGVNLQKGQRLEIMASIEDHVFAKMIMKKAFERGAADVFINWVDYESKKIRYLIAPEETFDQVPEWEIIREKRIKPENWSIISISVPNPEIYMDVDPEILGRELQLRSKTFQFNAHLRMNMEIKWCIALAASEGWAKKVYPDTSVKESVEKLWENIFKCSRVDTDNYLEVWDSHVSYLKMKYNLMTNKKYEKIIFKGPGTDISMTIADGSEWKDAIVIGYDNSEVIANIPTEEILAAPHKYSVNGVVQSTMPLVYNGNIVNNLWFKFENGKVVDFGADTGKESIQKFLDTDEGARYLGEVALVPEDSPIAQLKTLFYNTLYDENASCHFALGNAYTFCIRHLGELSDVEEDKIGFNKSAVHLDFMIGSKEMDIIGVKQNGEEEFVFKKGLWAI